MTGDIRDIDHAVMDVAKQHEVRYVGLQLFRQGRVATRASRLVGDDVRNVGRIEFRLGEGIDPKRLVAAVVLAAAGSLPPEAYLDGLRNAGDRHRYFTRRSAAISANSSSAA